MESIMVTNDDIATRVTPFCCVYLGVYYNFHCGEGVRWAHDYRITKN